MSTSLITNGVANSMDYLEIIDYWYSEDMQKHWFASTPVLDKKIKTKFEELWERAASGELDEWQETAEGCLALVIILDQLPLNMFRGQAKSFQTEQKSIDVTKAAIQKNFATQLSKDKLAFLFMPLMHSENIDDQDLSVKIFKEYELQHNIKFAEHHRNIINKFGRFPHRNIILNRESTAKEQEYLLSDTAFKG